jgi:hypothetical protein
MWSPEMRWPEVCLLESGQFEMYWLEFDWVWIDSKVVAGFLA